MFLLPSKKKEDEWKKKNHLLSLHLLPPGGHCVWPLLCFFLFFFFFNEFAWCDVCFGWCGVRTVAGALARVRAGSSQHPAVHGLEIK